MILFRSVGLKELVLIAESGFAAFPLRIPFQPRFYPVLNFEYARQIAYDWNTDDENSGFSGLVTRFDIADHYVEQFDTQTVGGRVHKELWVPS